MTHEDERPFHDRVADYFREKYGNEAVLSDIYLPKSRRFCDLIVETGYMTLAIEIENDFDAAIEGVGQALIYAGETHGVPIVVVPPGHIQEPERAHLSTNVPVIELDV